MNKETFSTLADSIPHLPGCYKYFDSNNTLIYVGKAKDLRKRVGSYFNKNLDNYKTRKLVAQIHSIDFTVTESEHDAFLLENSLIKHYQPHYNISLKDDKTYPYIVIKKEQFPRVFFTRRLIRDGSEYLGPFTGLGRVKELMELIKQSIPLRTCNLNLTHKNIQSGKFSVCLEYHLGNCKGPCIGLQTPEDYMQSIQYVRYVLKGNLNELLKGMKAEMETYAANLEFEKAQVLKHKLEYLHGYQSKSVVVNPRLHNLDVVTVLSDDANFYVNYMMVSQGSVIHAKTLKIQRKLDEAEPEVVALALDILKTTFQSNAVEVVAQFAFDLADPNMTITIPKVGDKKKLLDLSLKNAELFRAEMNRKKTLLVGVAGEENKKNQLGELQEVLRLPALPNHIECFDNSNFQGAFPVAAMVCFVDGMPNKKEYRHFHIKTVEGIDDFASMAEIVYRRYKRLSEEGKPLPDLIIIDGGKGQLHAALESIEKLGLTGKATLVGLAKKEELVFFAGDKEPLTIPFDSPAHLLLRRIRDEVHRFGITFHRKKRSEGTIKNELNEIPGIGPSTADALLKEFRSVKNISGLTERELTKIIGQSKARVVWGYFHPEG